MSKDVRPKPGTPAAKDPELNGYQRDIIQKLSSDPVYFIESCLSIVDQESRLVPFLLNPVQRDYMAKRTERDEIIKSRKMGFTSVITGENLHAGAFQQNQRIVIMSAEKEATKRVLRRVKDYLSSCVINIPVGDGDGGDTSQELFFPATKSWMYIGTAGAKTFGRGDDITREHFTEHAHYQNRASMTGAMEAILKGGYTRIVKETTANGAGTPCHESWLKAVRGDSGYRHHFYGWHQDPLNFVRDAQPFDLTDDESGLRDALSLTWGQLAWRRRKIAEMDRPELFPQEYPATWEEAFLASGAMVFDWTAVKRLDDTKTPTKWTGNIIDKGGSVDILHAPSGPLKIWRTPEARSRYLITVDVADGIPGRAYSVADVYDIRSWEQVAQWHGHADPVAFRDTVARLGAFYGWALIAVENNYPGNAVVSGLVEMGYPNIYGEGGKNGWTTTLQSKAEFISDGRAAVRDGSLKVNSEKTLGEFRTFVVSESGKMEPQEGCFQDTVIVACKAANILKTLRLEPEQRRSSFREVMGVGRRNLGPTGGNFSKGVV